MRKSVTQEQQEAYVDTLTESYSDQWGGMDNLEEASAIIQFMASNDLIFVVLGVSLIIWFVLLFFMVRVDRKISRLEKDLNQKEKDHET